MRLGILKDSCIYQQSLGCGYENEILNVLLSIACCVLLSYKVKKRRW